jgi:hypothetical protein
MPRCVWIYCIVLCVARCFWALLFVVILMQSYVRCLLACSVETVCYIRSSCEVREFATHFGHLKVHLSKPLAGCGCSYMAWFECVQHCCRVYSHTLIMCWLPACSVEPILCVATPCVTTCVHGAACSVGLFLLCLAALAGCGRSTDLSAVTEVHCYLAQPAQTSLALALRYCQC